MELDKEHIYHCFLFRFHQKKSAADAHRIICETYDKNVIAIRTSANKFKQVKNSNFYISDKKRSDCSAIVEEDELQKDEKKMKNTSINLYYFDFIVVKKIAKIAKELLHQPNI